MLESAVVEHPTSSDTLSASIYRHQALKQHDSRYLTYTFCLKSYTEEADQDAADKIGRNGIH